MIAKKPVRQVRPPRDLSPKPDTENQRIAKTAGDRYYYELAGTLRRDARGPTDRIPGSMHFVIKDRENPGKSIECKALTQSEVEARVTRLNDDTPLNAGERRQWGIQNKPGRISAGAIRSIGMPSPTECMERLVLHAPTRVELFQHQRENRKLHHDKLVELLRSVIEPDAWARFDRYPRRGKFLDSLAQHIRDKYKIRRGGHY